jgi:hypothetical protein
MSGLEDARTRVLCLIVSLPQHLTRETVWSVIGQSISNFTTFLTKKSELPSLIQRIADAENDGLSHVNLSHFDYILKVDGDTVLGKDFVKNNLIGDPDVVGGGSAMLIKVSAFNEVMNGKFYAECEDPYIRVKFQMANKKVQGYREAPLYMGSHPLDAHYFIELGQMYYRLGWIPTHMASMIFEKPPRNLKKIFIVLSYFVACLTKPKKMDTFNFVRAYQIRSLTRHITDALWRL